MKSLYSLNKYFLKYKWRLLTGVFFVIVSNVFGVLPPGIIRNVLNDVYNSISRYQQLPAGAAKAGLYDQIIHLVVINGLLLVLFAILRGVFMFCMRQTLIVMSRKIEYDQKIEIFDHYQKLDTAFFKTHNTGDLMSRMAEDVSRVRSYTGPAIMYFINLVSLTILSLVLMIRQSPTLTFYVLAPLPILAFTIYKVNGIINKKSERIQAQLSQLTTNAQEAYSGIRVIKSFVQENNLLQKFIGESQKYKDSNINLSKTEAVFFPSMTLFVGISTLLTILIGGWQVMKGEITVGNIAEFITYINILMFPFSALGYTASITQRGAASQQRINEFLEAASDIHEPEHPAAWLPKGEIIFRNVCFTYPDTKIQALKNLNLVINPGEKIAILGKTGSGKSTIAHLLMRMYDADSGQITIDGIPITQLDLKNYREKVSYVPQEVFLFSDTVANNIRFGLDAAPEEAVKKAAQMAVVDHDIESLPRKYETVVGERGVMLSGGQKQRVAIARALIKTPEILIMDDSLSAVDTKTEYAIVENLKHYLGHKTAFIITHRIFQGWDFDKILVLEDGHILESGTHETLMEKNGYYARLYRYQILGIVPDENTTIKDS